MSKEAPRYPSPTAAHSGGGAGPYHPGKPAEDDHDDNELQAQLRHEIEKEDDQNAQHQQQQHHVAYSSAQADPNFMGTSMNFGYQGMNLPGNQATPIHQSQHHAMVTSDVPVGYGAEGDESAKKKSKVTRACDECRRKKIKCDANVESAGLAKCSNCNRTNSECLFSKPAQKRGPSRGYIRDLSDRVADLERQKKLREGGSYFSPLPVPKHPDQSPPMGLPIPGSKRSHDESEGIAATNGYSTYTQSVAPQANMIGNPPTTGPDSQLQQSSLNAEEASYIQAFQNSPYRWSFPIVFLDGGEVESLVGDAPTVVRQGFFIALRAILLISERDQGDNTASFVAYKHLTEIALDPVSLPPMANLVHLQSIVLTLWALSYDGHPMVQPSPVASSSALYGIASGIISHLGLHKMNVRDANDSFLSQIIYTHGRRALWALCVIAQWDSLGMGKMRTILKGDLHLTSGDRIILGPLWFSMASITVPICALHESILMENRTAQESEINTKRFEEQLELVEGFIDPVPEQLTANAMILGAKMLFSRYRLNGRLSIPDSHTVGLATTAINLLVDNDNGDFPLSHHILALAARTCIEAIDFKEVKESARQSLEKLIAAIDSGVVLKHNAWKQSIAKVCKEKLNSLGGLQHLANAAVGAAEGEVQKEAPADLTSVVTDGYLNALV